jgi:hypothetical protein
MITVKELLKACQEQVAKGNGDKGILLGCDEDGDRFNPCVYLFSEDVFEYVTPESLGMTNKELGECIILG